MAKDFILHQQRYCIVFLFIVKQSWQNAAIYNMRIGR